MHECVSYLSHHAGRTDEKHMGKHTHRGVISASAISSSVLIAVVYVCIKSMETIVFVPVLFLFLAGETGVFISKKGQNAHFHIHTNRWWRDVFFY